MFLLQLTLLAEVLNIVKGRSARYRLLQLVEALDIVFNVFETISVVECSEGREK
jgi:hypothetical protein